MEKNLDGQGRWRSRYVGFRMSPEESELLNHLVEISGQSKQEYITNKLLNRDIVVEPNPRVYKMLREQLKQLLDEMKRMENCTDAPPEQWIQIEQINKTIYGIKGGEENEQ